MARVEKTVFISYRRADRWPALAVFKDLTQHGYDAFIDYEGIGSGDFERAIVDNIRARAHFVLLLTPTALDRCDDPADWLRREIEVALEAGRNIVPLWLEGFTFRDPMAVQRLTGSLAPLLRYQALTVPSDFFDEAMVRLRSRHLAIAVDAVLHPVSPRARQVAEHQRVAASKAADLPAAEPARAGPSPAVAKSPAPEGSTPAATSTTSRVPGTLARGLPVVALLVLVVAIFLAKDLWRRQEVSAPAPALAASSDVRPTADEPTAPAAQAALGYDHYYGQNGRLQNDTQAAIWFRKAAEQGNATGQSGLGVMYEAGRGGLAEDKAAAVKWYRKAAEQGNAAGQGNLGRMYESGEGGLPKDEAEAAKWYRKAAEQGNPAGQAYLADMYEFGKGGLAKNTDEAVRLYRLAANQGNDFAAKALKRLGQM